jgi:hypothetical protein
MRRVMGLAEGTKVTKKLLRASMTRPQYEAAWQAYSDRLKQQVEQSLTEEDDIPDHAPPAPVTSVEANGNRAEHAVGTDGVPMGTAPNGQPALTADERQRWGALSRRSLRAVLSPTTWDGLRQDDYAAAERVIATLEGQAQP